MERAPQPADHDPILARLVDDAVADPSVNGLLLTGSRSIGVADADSDYDITIVLTDAAYQAQADRGEPHRRKRRPPSEPLQDIVFTCPHEFAQLAAAPDWRSAGYAGARILLDKTGTIADLLTAISTMPEEKARAGAAGWFDAYLNAFYRSLKAWRRGDELGGRLEASESVMHVVRTLFALERHWPPYHDRLLDELHHLQAQGWPPDTLQQTLLTIVRTGDPKTQQAFERQVEALMRERGFAVSPDWGDEIERVKALRFD